MKEKMEDKISKTMLGKRMRLKGTGSLIKTFKEEGPGED
jgi:hypothetical protein